MNIPNQLPTLASGAHEEGARQVCAMEAASWLAREKHSDRPECVHPAIAEVARIVNDRVDEATRQTLWPLIMRSMGTASDDKMLSVKLAIWCARKVLIHAENYAPSDDRPRKAIEAAEAWIACPCEKHATAANATAYATDATAAAYAADAASATAYAAKAAANATACAAKAAANATAYAANATAYATANADLVEFWTGLLDEYDAITGRTETPQPSQSDWERLTEFAR